MANPHRLTPGLASPSRAAAAHRRAWLGGSPPAGRRLVRRRLPADLVPPGAAPARPARRASRRLRARGSSCGGWPPFAWRGVATYVAGAASAPRPPLSRLSSAVPAAVRLPTPPRPPAPPPPLSRLSAVTGGRYRVAGCSPPRRCPRRPPPLSLSCSRRPYRVAGVRPPAAAAASGLPAASPCPLCPGPIARRGGPSHAPRCPRRRPAAARRSPWRVLVVAARGLSRAPRPPLSSVPPCRPRSPDPSHADTGAVSRGGCIPYTRRCPGFGRPAAADPATSQPETAGAHGRPARTWRETRQARVWPPGRAAIGASALLLRRRIAAGHGVWPSPPPGIAESGRHRSSLYRRWSRPIRAAVPALSPPPPPGMATWAVGIAPAYPPDHRNAPLSWHHGAEGISNGRRRWRGPEPPRGTRPRLAAVASARRWCPHPACRRVAPRPPPLAAQSPRVTPSRLACWPSPGMAGPQAGLPACSRKLNAW